MWVLNRIASSRAPGGHSPSYYRVLGLLADATQTPDAAGVSAANAAPDHATPKQSTHGADAPLAGKRIGELASAVHVSQPGMTKIVHALEALGAVQRTQDPADSRATLVSITDAGRALLSERASQIVTHLLPDFAPLSEDERRTLQDAVDILGKHMPGESTTPKKELS